MHISQNGSLHEFKQTEEEVLVTIFKEMKQVYNKSTPNTRDDLAAACLRGLHTRQEKNARLQKVLQHEDFCMFFLMRIMSLGPHFRHRPEFKVNWLVKAINTCMGVSVLVYRERQSDDSPVYIVIFVMDQDADGDIGTVELEGSVPEL
jgi:hypothetical protein